MSKLHLMTTIINRDQIKKWFICPGERGMISGPAKRFPEDSIFCGMHRLMCARFM